MPQSTARAVLSATAYDAIKERIMDHELEPNGRLNMDALAAELKVSQTPIREALARLTAEGLVEFAAFRGYVVAPILDERQLEDMLRVRKLLETDAVLRAVTRIGLAELRLLEGLLEDMRKLHLGLKFRQYRAFNQLDQRYHESLIKAADSHSLQRSYAALHVHVHLARYDQNRDEERFRVTMQEHEAIYDALKARDGEAAIVAVSRHIDNVYLRVIDPTMRG